MSLPRYPKYKDSGVEWLGHVPAHWSVSRVGFESWVRARLGWKGLKADEYVDEGFVFLATPNIKGTRIDFENVNYIDAYRYEESPEIKLRVGDVLLAKDGSTLGTVNVVRTLPRPATVNSSIAVITPYERIDGVFLYYLFQSAFMVETIQRIKGGMGVPHLFQEDLTKFYLPLPSKFEQCTIVEFLDRETSKIDGLVEEQRRLIELLKEKRQAVIAHAVTKGHNPNAPMKPSGIGWLGEIPVHWGLVHLDKLVQSHRQITYGIVQPGERDESGRFMVRGQDYSNGWAIPDQVFRVSDEVEIPYRRARLNTGDLVVTIVGAGVGNVACVPEWLDGANITQTTARIAVDNAKAEPGFVATVLQSSVGRHLITLFSKGAAQPGINLEHLRSFGIPLPPLPEQRGILSEIEASTLQFDELTGEATRAIDLLQERRSALISAAVTGEIDVRASVQECVT